jgi:hypothetical protein
MGERVTDKLSETLGGSAAAGKLIADDRNDRDGQRSGPSRVYGLQKKKTPSEGIRRIAAGRAQQAIEELRSAARGEEPAESIHSTRKDLKKLRSLLRLVRGELGEGLYKSENERYREVGRSLSATRDAQVKAETLRSLLEHSEIEPAVERAAASWEGRWSRRTEEPARRPGAAASR